MWAASQPGVDPFMLPKVDHVAVVNRLIGAGADVDFRDEGDRTMLGVAAEKGSIRVLNPLLRHGANMSAANQGLGCTALHLAAAHGRVDAIDALMDAGAVTELNDSEGLTVLSAATSKSQYQAMRVPLQRGANADVRDYRGNTLLHVACRVHGDGVDEVMELLLRVGVDEAAVNIDGKTPLETMESRPIWWGGGRSSPEMERARLLLARAPADRKWRRRRWLVMIRSRVKAIPASRGTGGRDGGVRFKMTSDHQSGAGERGLFGQIGDGCVVGAGGEDGGLRAVVESLAGLEIEGLFRMVVAFL